MTKLFNKLVTIVAITWIAGCNSASTDSKTTEAESKVTAFDMAAAKSWIATNNTKFVEDFKKGDSAAVAGHYADDAIILPPNMEPVKENGIASFWGSFMKMGIKDFKLITDDIAGDQNLLAETGRYELYGAENKLMDKGKYLVVWKPSNGGWKLYRDMFSSDMPAAPAK